jgi:hypothetical protein
MRLQVFVNHVFQNSFTPLFRSNLGKLQPPRIALRLSSHPPCNQCQNSTKTNEAHSHGEGDCVVRRVLASEQLRANGTSNLTVAVDKSNRKGGARSSRGRLYSPGPIVALAIVFGVN